jgi:hypothetical protein
VLQSSTATRFLRTSRSRHHCEITSFIQGRSFTEKKFANASRKL